MKELLSRYPALSYCEKSICDALDLMINTYKNGGKILVCGNGGSAADSEHIVGELMKAFIKKREVNDKRLPQKFQGLLQYGLPAISLPSQSAILSAYINDVSPEMMFAQLVYGYGKENDLLIGISTSGNSQNVVNAVELANCIGVKTLSMTGCKASKMSEISTVTIQVPEIETYKIQELHLPVYHYLCAKTEAYFFN
jgi:D-sedoheptulose 7-phosphate isomerase